MASQDFSNFLEALPAGALKGYALCVSPRLLFPALLLLAACSKGSAPVVGRPAPEFKLDKVLQAPVERFEGWKSLQGKAVVLEFWDTGCVSCVDAIPHLNDLAERFKDRPVVFLSVTKDDEETVRAFLKGRPMRGWVGLDLAKRAYDAFRVRAVPRTFIVDAGGRLVADTYPGMLDAETLEKALAGALIEAPTDAQKETAALRAMLGLQDEEPLPALLVRVSPTRPGADGGKYGPGLFKQFGITFEDMAAYAYEGRRGRVDFRSTRALERCDVLLYSAGADEARKRRLMGEALQTLFPHKARREARTVDVYRLVMRAGPAPGRRKPADTDVMGGGGKKGSGSLKYKNTPLSWLASGLERELERPVFDKTGSKESFDFEIVWDAGKKGALEKALDPIGVRLIPAKAPVDYLVVEEERP